MVIDTLIIRIRMTHPPEQAVQGLREPVRIAGRKEEGKKEPAR